MAIYFDRSLQSNYINNELNEMDNVYNCMCLSASSFFVNESLDKSTIICTFSYKLSSGSALTRVF